MAATVVTAVYYNKEKPIKYKKKIPLKIGLVSTFGSCAIYKPPKVDTTLKILKMFFCCRQNIRRTQS